MDPDSPQAELFVDEFKAMCRVDTRGVPLFRVNPAIPVAELPILDKTIYEQAVSKYLRRLLGTQGRD
jgi:hypothetical protein